MKKFLKLTLFLLTAFVMTSTLSSCGYNGMVNRDEAVKSQWAQVENVYQRRSDLIPNLVSTVKGEANFEKSTLVAVQEARSEATKVTIDPSKLTQDDVARYQKVQDGLGSTISRLMMVTENYPSLKSNEAFMALQSQLEGTENRITVERQKFNEVTRDYNSFIRGFPNNMFANMFGFHEKGYFTASPGSEKAPTVNF